MLHTVGRTWRQTDHCEWEANLSPEATQTVHTTAPCNVSSHLKHRLRKQSSLCLIHTSSPAGEASSKANHATKCGLMARCLQQPFLFKWQKCTKGSQALPIGNGNFLHCHSTKLRSSASNALIFGAGSLARAQGEPDPQRHGLQELQARHMMEKGIARLHAHRLGPRPDKSICTHTMGRVLSGANLARLRGK